MTTAPFYSADEPPTHAGYAALAGLPNAGKSSLLNVLVEQKLSIVSSTPQTTRERVVGIDTRGSTQIVFLDTPGIPTARLLLHESMESSIRRALSDADVIVLVADASRPGLRPAPEFFASLPQGAPLLVALNKSDLASPGSAAEARRWAREVAHKVLGVSARTGAGVEALRGEISRRLPPSPFLYPAEEIATQSTRFFVSELIRETALELYAAEIPHSVAVKVEEFREEGDPLYIRAVIYVERDSQKPILLGRGGTAIKRLGREARHKVEQLVGRRTYLDLWVKVLPRWRKDAQSLRRLGFTLPPSALS